MVDEAHPPLYKTLGEIAALWIAADAGYWIVLPLFDIGISYNESPVVIALYYAFWLFVGIVAFRDSLLRRIHTTQLWSYAVLSLGLSGAALIALYILSRVPVPVGTPLAPYTDILFASPWYFLPKAMEILVQQTLVAALVFALAAHYRSIRAVSAAYALLFGGAHVIIFSLSGTPTPYAVTMTVGSLASAALFPFLMLRAKNGFVYAYAIHVAFYIVLALALHTWPPPDYP